MPAELKKFQQDLLASVRGQGRREPNGAAKTLLRVAVAHPEVLRELHERDDAQSVSGSASTFNA